MYLDNSLVVDVRLNDENSGYRIVGKKEAKSNPQRHFHNSWEILYIAEGNRNFFYGHKTYSIGAGDFLCVEPGVLHRGINQTVKGKNNTCSLYNVYFTMDETVKGKMFFQIVEPMLKELINNHGPIIHVNEKYHNDIIKNFYEIVLEFTEKKINYEEKAFSNLLTILSITGRSNNYENNNGIKLKEKKCEKIMEFISQNYNKAITLNDVANHFSMSSSYLSRMFKQNTEFSFIEYLNSIRINHSCEMLKKSENKITDIAFDCGFGTVTQFGRIFKTFTGMSPKDFRKKNK